MKYIYITLFFSLLPLVSFSQRPTDLELWTGAELEFKLNKKFSVSISEQVRFNDRVSSLKKSFTQVGMDYKIGKRFSLSGNYRFTFSPNENVSRRIALDANYKWKEKGKPVSIKYRLRYQNVFGGQRTYIRNKIKFDYNLSKLVYPSVAYELFFRLNGRNEFRVSRITLGLDWRITKQFEMTTFYRLQDDIFVNSPERQHIVGLMLAYELDLKKRRKSRIE